MGILGRHVTDRVLFLQLEMERMRRQLVEVQSQVCELEGEIDGKRESARVRVFLDHLSTAVSPIEDRIALFQSLLKAESLRQLSTGSNVRMVFTPADANLRIDA